MDFLWTPRAAWKNIPIGDKEKTVRDLSLMIILAVFQTGATSFPMLY
jgi:hypothetical protein